MADQGIVSGGTFLATVALAHWAVPSEVGEYAVGVSTLFLFAGLQEALITTPYTIRRHRSELDPAALAGGALLQGGALAALATCGLLLAGLVALLAGAGDLATLATALGLLAPFLFLREFARQLSFAHGETGSALITDCLTTALQMGGIACLGLVGVLTAETAFLASAMGFAAVGGWFVRHRARFQFRLRHFWCGAAENLALGRWLGAAQIALSIQGFVSSWMLALMIGWHAAGIYAACMTLVSLANPVIIGCTNVLLPEAALTLRREGILEMWRQLIRQTYAFGALLTGFCVFLALGSSWATGLLFRGPDYQGQTDTILALAVALLIRAVGIPASNGLATLERPRAILWTTLGAAVMNIALGLALIPLWSVFGAALGFLAGNLVGTAGRWVALVRLPEIRSLPWTARARQVLRESEQTKGEAEMWAIRLLGEGNQAVVMAASQSGDDPGSAGNELVIKLYKASITRAAVLEQFEALRVLHATLDGLVLRTWRIAVPTPLRLCGAPLALVMTKVPGRSVWDHLAYPERSRGVDIESVAEAIARAAKALWSAGYTYGDINLDNVLCDPESHTVSFVDPGIPSQSLQEGWSLPSQDLAYFFFEWSVSLRRAFSHPRTAARVGTFTAEVIRMVLQNMSEPADRQRLLSEIQVSMQQLLRELPTSWTPRGAWRLLLRYLGYRRIANLAKGLRMEIDHVAD